MFDEEKKSKYEGWASVLKRDMPDVLQKFEPEIQKASVIYDIGANVGSFADEVLSKYPNMKMVLFEPVKEYYEFLVYKFKDNKNIEIYNYAIVDSERDLEISVDPYNLGWNTLSEINEYGDLQSIKGTSLSSIVLKNKILLPDLIKIDVENSEYLVIEGCKKLFKHHVPDKLVVEIGVLPNNKLWEKEEAMFEYLYSLGYKRDDYKKYTNTYDAIFSK